MKQLSNYKKAWLGVLAVSVAFWLFLVITSVAHPVPAGACAQGDGLCISGQHFWGNVLWGSYWAVAIMVPFWFMAGLITLALKTFTKFTRHRQPLTK